MKELLIDDHSTRFLRRRFLGVADGAKERAAAQGTALPQDTVKLSPQAQGSLAVDHDGDSH